MSPFPDDHAIVAASRLIDVQPDALERFLEAYRDTDGYVGPEFGLKGYPDAVEFLGRNGYDVSPATLRGRMHRGGFYVEGVDYLRKGARTVVFSRRILARERQHRGEEA